MHLILLHRVTPFSQMLAVAVLDTEEDGTDVSRGCDFENEDLCGWSVDRLAPLFWRRVPAGQFHQGMTLLLPRDHTTGADNRVTGKHL